MSVGNPEALIRFLFLCESRSICYIGLMNPRDRLIADRFKKLLLEKIRPLEVRVFGSRARGDASTESDLDVLVVVEHATREIEKFVSDCAWEAGFDEGVVVVPIVIGRDKLDGPLRQSVFVKNVYREGLTI